MKISSLRRGLKEESCPNTPYVWTVSPLGSYVPFGDSTSPDKKEPKNQKGDSHGSWDDGRTVGRKVRFAVFEKLAEAK
jgi:hypothetical protein